MWNQKVQLQCHWTYHNNIHYLITKEEIQLCCWNSEQINEQALFSFQSKPSTLKIYREVLRTEGAFAVRARTGHIMMRQYFHCFHLYDSPLYTACRETEETLLEHILLQCTVFNQGKEALKWMVNRSSLSAVLTNKNL